jgi:hypothetical protein
VDVERLAQWRVFALCLAGRTEKANEILATAEDWIEPRDLETWSWLAQTFGLTNPFPSPRTD